MLSAQLYGLGKDCDNEQVSDCHNDRFDRKRSTPCRDVRSSHETRCSHGNVLRGIVHDQEMISNLKLNVESYLMRCFTFKAMLFSNNEKILEQAER